MKPEQAWEHVKELDPRAECISPYYGSSDATNVQLGNGRAYSIPIAIEWPPGVDRWPMAEEQYRHSMMPQDYGKEVEVRDGKNDIWSPAILAGFASSSVLPWFTHLGSKWRYARIRVTQEVTQEVATCKESLPVDPVAWREVQ